MTVDNTVVKELSDQYFNGAMPKKFEAYLYDRYETEPEYGITTPETLWSWVISDIESYKNGTLDITLRTPLQKMEEHYDDLCSVTNDFSQANRRLEQELKYLNDYISWKCLEDDFRYFRDNAHLQTDEDNPFPSYVL